MHARNARKVVSTWSLQAEPLGSRFHSLISNLKTSLWKKRRLMYNPFTHFQFILMLCFSSLGPDPWIWRAAFPPSAKKEKKKKKKKEKKEKPDPWIWRAAFPPSAIAPSPAPFSCCYLNVIFFFPAFPLTYYTY